MPVDPRAPVLHQELTHLAVRFLDARKVSVEAATPLERAIGEARAREAMAELEGHARRHGHPLQVPMGPGGSSGLCLLIYADEEQRQRCQEYHQERADQLRRARHERMGVSGA